MPGSRMIARPLALLAISLCLAAGSRPLLGDDKPAPRSTDTAPSLSGKGALSVVVRDLARRPIHGAVVVLSGGAAILPQPVAQADAGGIATFPSLPAGTYSAVAYYGPGASAAPVQVSGNAHTWTEIILPIDIADFDLDGFVTSNDFFEFVMVWNDSLWEADFNRDGRVDTQDFFEYLRAFLTDCTGDPDEEPAVD